jgi:hypothetical protein
MQTVRLLTEVEINNIDSEIAQLQSARLFSGHASDASQYMVTGALREGRTVWFHHIGSTKLCHTQIAPTITSIIQTAINETGQQLGRAYVHTLLPNQQIYPHADIGPYFDDIDRYHIYTTIPNGLVITLGGKQVLPNSISNSISIFPHAQVHHYTNSQVAATFVVFDLYRK